ncbi:MAG: hypothetical protein AAFU60_08500 [Bacteroidota bacterium]
MATFTQEGERLRKEWEQAWITFGVSPDQLASHWSFLTRNYTGVGRTYHNFRHLEQMFQALQDFDVTTDRAILAMAILYHDVIYVVHRRDNEERSAILAEQHLLEANIDSRIAERVGQLIRLTQKHQLGGSKDPLAPILLDTDLGILGSPWSRYEEYIHQIRREYRIYPTVLYRRGRIQVLQHLLKVDQLYHTPDYQERFEEKARTNLVREIEYWQG